jgi:hypothetical protein
MYMEALSSGVKQQGPEADHSPPPIAEFKKVGAIPPLSQYFHGVVLNLLSTDTDYFKQSSPKWSVLFRFPN